MNIKLLFLILFPFFCFSQKMVIVKGHAPFLRDGTLVILKCTKPDHQKSEPEVKVYKTTANQNRFNFEIEEKGAELYHLTIGKSSDYIYLAPGTTNISIQDSLFKNISFDDQTAKEYKSFDDDSTRVALKSRYLWLRVDRDEYLRREVVDSSIVMKKTKDLDSARKIQQQYALSQCSKWIRLNPNSLINSKILFDQIETMPDDSIKKLYKLIPIVAKGNSYGKELHYWQENLLFGAQAPLFTGKDINGNNISLSEFKGKFVLLDFWASWCLPCRKSNPYLLSAYQNHRKSKKFSILGISLDDNKEQWVDAIAKDMLTWTNLSDLNGFDNDIARKYAVKSIPTNYLINPLGRIVARNIEPEKLSALIDELVKR